MSKKKELSSSNGAMRPGIELVWQECAPRLSQFIRSRVADPATAEDILHDVFVRFQSRLDEFREPAKIQGWLFLVARNAVIDYYRTRRQTSELSESLPAETPATETIEIEELHVMLRQIIDGLPKPYREAFVLTAFEGLSQKELARHLRISLSGAKSRVQRARERLKEMLLDFVHREFGGTPGCQPCPRGLFPIVTTSGRVAKRKPTPRQRKSKQLR
jgi:RNA polymerase sigma-70 factor (ECF subfamily)